MSFEEHRCFGFKVLVMFFVVNDTCAFSYVINQLPAAKKRASPKMTVKVPAKAVEYTVQCYVIRYDSHKCVVKSCQGSVWELGDTAHRYGCLPATSVRK